MAPPKAAVAFLQEQHPAQRHQLLPPRQRHDRVAGEWKALRLAFQWLMSMLTLTEWEAVKPTAR